MPGLATFVAKAAKFHGVAVANNYGADRVWGFTSEASPERREEAPAYTGSFISSLHMSVF